MSCWSGTKWSDNIPEIFVIASPAAAGRGDPGYVWTDSGLLRPPQVLAMTVIFGIALLYLQCQKIVLWLGIATPHWREARNDRIIFVMLEGATATDSIPRQMHLTRDSIVPVRPGLQNDRMVEATYPGFYRPGATGTPE